MPTAPRTLAARMPLTSAAAVVATTVTSAPRPSALAPMAAVAATAVRAPSASACASARRSNVSTTRCASRPTESRSARAIASGRRRCPRRRSMPLAMLPPALRQLRGEAPATAGSPGRPASRSARRRGARQSPARRRRPAPRTPAARAAGSAGRRRGRCAACPRRRPGRAPPSRRAPSRPPSSAARSRAPGPRRRAPAAASSRRAPRCPPASTARRSAATRLVARRQRAADAERVGQLQPEPLVVVEGVAQPCSRAARSRSPPTARARHAWPAMRSRALTANRCVGASEQLLRAPGRRTRAPAPARARCSKMSTLLTTTTIFLPQSRIVSRNARSVSVNGRSAEVTNSTRSARGTNSRVRRSCSRWIALVPGVSTMCRSRSSSTGAVTTERAGRIVAGREGRAVANQLDARGGRRHAFLEHALAEQRVDERALAGVELADDDEQEELVELTHRGRERREVRGGGRQRDQQVAQPAEVLAHVDELPLGRPASGGVRRRRTRPIVALATRRSSGAPPSRDVPTPPRP